MTSAVQRSPASVVASDSPITGGVDGSVLEAQRLANAELAKMPHPDPRTPDGLAELRALIAPPQQAPELTPEDVLIDGPGGALRLHIFMPDGVPLGVIVRIHGGGWVGGAPEDDEALNDHISRTCQVAIVSPEYRLAPENGVTILDQIEDCLAAVRWAHESSARFGTERMMIAGTSGGAHLAAATLLRLRDSADPAFKTIIGAHLDSGPYDVSGTPSQRLATDQTLIVTPMWLEAFRELAFPGRDLEKLRDPGLSPMYADLTGLPPAMFVVGALDPLIDDSLFMAARWQAAGNHATIEAWPVGAHTFMNMGTPLAQKALARTTAWISETLASRPTFANQEHNIAVVQRFIDGAVNGQDPAVIHETWSEDMTWHGGSLGTFQGRAAFQAAFAANATSAWSEMHLEIREITATGDKVVLRFTNSGTNVGPFMGNPPSGKRAQWLGIGIYTIHNGRITEGWFAEDVPSLLAQLDVLPAPPEAESSDSPPIELAQPEAK